MARGREALVGTAVAHPGIQSAFNVALCKRAELEGWLVAWMAANGTAASSTAASSTAAYVTAAYIAAAYIAAYIAT
jgi:hypothetical protein